MPSVHLHTDASLQHSIAVDEEGNAITFYLPENAGGAGKGFRPMQSLLAGMAGCATIDILLILKKQKQNVTSVQVTVDGERVPNQEPSLWENAHIVFHIEGEVEPAKAEKAVELSMNKYCSVAATLRQAGASLTWETQVIASLPS